MKRLLLVSLLALSCAATSGSAAAADASNASQGISDASAMVVGGSLMAIAGAGTVVVGSVKAVGEGLELVLEGGVQASAATVRLSGRAARGLSIAAGTTLEVVALSTGHMLVLSGKALAFIPNEAGQVLLHHARTI